MCNTISLLLLGNKMRNSYENIAYIFYYKNN